MTKIVTKKTLAEIEQSIKSYESPLIPTVRMLIRNIKALMKSETNLHERIHELEAQLRTVEYAKNEAFDKGRDVGRQEAFAVTAWRRAHA